MYIKIKYKNNNDFILLNYLKRDFVYDIIDSGNKIEYLILGYFIIGITIPFFVIQSSLQYITVKT